MRKRYVPADETYELLGLVLSKVPFMASKNPRMRTTRLLVVWLVFFFFYILADESREASAAAGHAAEG
jgi:hypothetical protein